MSAGAEFEASDFWRSTEPLQRALAEMDFLREDAFGTDVLGDIYEHILSKLSLAGQFGQFRTPKHIVEFMVAIADPRDGELVVDPACGTGGFLVAASEFRRRKERSGRHEGIEIDRTVARIASANLAFHDVGEGHISNADGLGPLSERADVILANPPFAGSVSEEVTQRFAVRSKKTELLFLEQMCGLLKPGGRAVVVVPYGAVSGASGDGKSIRSMLVTDHSLRAVIELPSGVFRPYTDVKTAILVWEATPRGTETHMIRVENDGLSLDQRRVPVAFNDLPEALAVLGGGNAAISHRLIPTAEIVAASMNLNPSRYLAEVQRAERDHIDSEDVLMALAARLTSTLDKVTRLKEETAP
jgi:type I restriction enzyme M protein